MQAALFFVPETGIFNLQPFGSGNVNETYLVTLVSGEQRVLQRLNPDVFPDPMLVIHNMRLVTDHLRETASGTPYRPVTLFSGISGDAYLDDAGGAWRMMSMVPGGHTCQSITTPGQAYELGCGLGRFHSFLRTMDPAVLADTLPGFHDTPRYLAHYDQVLAASGKSGRQENKFCYRFIDQRRAGVGHLEQDRHLVSHGIIHGDPKVANFLFDETLQQVISLIDLDTVKPGILLHDLGDALRSCCNSSGELPSAPDRVSFDSILFAAWLKGYFAAAGKMLTEEDRVRIVDAAALIGFELGLRFYTDYLEGDRYFRVRFAQQNLQRALTQFYLVRAIESQAEQLRDIVHDLAARQE